MILVDLTLASPEANLALDEALLRECEAAGEPREFLRFWESPQHFVVLGVAGKLRLEVQTDACREDGVPVLRRASGGGTVVQGPGCLNYGLVLSLRSSPELADLRRSYRIILERAAAALDVPGLVACGVSDLAVERWKVSGNAQKRTRSAVLHHGTILYAFDLKTLPRWLREPEQQPDYRAQRNHLEFVRNLPLPRDEIQHRLENAWGARPARWQAPELSDLIREKYGNPEWTTRF